MLSVKEKTTIVGVTELRKVIPKVLKKMKTDKVVLTKRNKPIGILLDYQEYERIEELLNNLEDFILGQMATERASRKQKKMIDLELAEKRVGLK